MKLWLVGVSLAAMGGCAAPGDGTSWKSSAAGLFNAHYTGADSAMIHLQGFSSRVSNNAQGAEVTGTTSNRTPFVCVKTKAV